MTFAQNSKCKQRAKPKAATLDLQAVLHSLRLVLEMEPDHLDHAIDLLDEAIHRDQRRVHKPAGCRI